MRKLIVSLLLVFILGAVAAAQTTALPTSESRLGQQRIAREVLHEMLMLPYYSVWDNLQFRVDGNTVTLLGQVVNGSLKPDAEAAAKRVEGVEKVVNNIEILPPSSLDDQIRRAEYRAIYGSDGLSKYSWGAVPSIHIVVKNGHVTLVGVVDTEADKQLAEIRAKGVPNVFSVDNQLQVAGGGKSK